MSMASGSKAWWTVSTVLLVSNLQYWACMSLPQVPGLFVFGDSMFDNGNNNVLATVVKADFLPNGIDFPHGSTGRFSDGVTVADVIADQLGFENHIPIFGMGGLSDYLRGVNYAASGGGILNMTGYLLGERLSMDLQLYNHKIMVSRIAKQLGSADVAKKYLGQCIYALVMGHNDYLNNYYSEGHNSSEIYTPDEFAELLIQTYEIQLERLYNEGARKVAVLGLIRIGCMPAYIETYGADESLCVDKLNNDVQIFNKKLQKLVLELNANLPGARFTYINSYEIDSENFSELGFKVTNKSCCETPSGGVRCTRLSYPCANRNEYVYWDGAHYTEARARVFGKRAYRRQLSVDAYPYDISELVQIPIDEIEDQVYSA